MISGTIHLVDDDDDLRHALAQALELEGLDVIAHSRADSVLEALGRDDYSVVVTDGVAQKGAGH